MPWRLCIAARGGVERRHGGNVWPHPMVERRGIRRLCLSFGLGAAHFFCARSHPARCAGAQKRGVVPLYRATTRFFPASFHLKGARFHFERAKCPKKGRRRTKKGRRSTLKGRRCGLKPRRRALKRVVGGKRWNDAPFSRERGGKRRDDGHRKRNGALSKRDGAPFLRTRGPFLWKRGLFLCGGARSKRNDGEAKRRRARNLCAVGRVVRGAGSLAWLIRVV